MRSRSGATRRGRAAFIVLALLFVVGGAAWRQWARSGNAENGSGASAPLRLVEASAAPSQTGNAVLTATGKIVSDHRVEVVTKVSGQIVSLHFEQGDFVEQGQVLARIEDVLYRARRDEAAANLRKSQANREYQRINAERIRRLHGHTLAPPIELADAERSLAESEAQVAADEAALAFAEKAFADTVVVAPIRGVILDRNVEVGDFVAAEGGRAALANALFASIADMEKLRVEVDISELDVARIRPGMPCVVRPDAYKDRQYDGHVMWIDPGANYAKATVQAKVRISNPDSALRVEGSAQVTFLEPPATQPVGPGAWIPVSAVRREAGDEAIVFVATNGRLKATRVRVTGSAGDEIFVAGDIRPGEKVVLEPAAELRDGWPAR